MRENHSTSKWIWRRKGGEWNEEKGECVGIGMEERETKEVVLVGGGNVLDE